VSIPTVQNDLRIVEVPINHILTDTSADAEDRDVLRDYVHSSAKALALKVTNTDTVANGSTCLSKTPILSTGDGGDIFYGSFDDWLASFTSETKDNLETPAQRLGFMRSQKEKTMVEGMLYWVILRGISNGVIQIHRSKK
jgi:hypothetical protein